MKETLSTAAGQALARVRSLPVEPARMGGAVSKAQQSLAGAGRGGPAAQIPAALIAGLILGRVVKKLGS